MSYLIATLNYALSRKRPYKGKGEAELRSFVRRLIGGASTIDDCGNLIIDRRQRHDGKTSRTLFVAHMDTVHREDGRNVFVQDKKAGKLKACGAPLGADDGAGVAILVHLLKHGVPGLYVFTVGEERGGVGAKYFAKEQAKLLTDDIDRAIAFDRRGGTSVITHQGCGKCASDEFAEALALELSNANDALLYMPDDTGVYTDTAEFTDYVAECTNISVGYDREHSEEESLDMRHFEALAQAVLLFDWDALPVARTPGDDGYVRGWWSWGSVIKTVHDDHDTSRESRWLFYDAMDMAERGNPELLRATLLDYLLDECNHMEECDAMSALLDQEDFKDPDLIDLMYDAAGGDPGFEVAAAALTYAKETQLRDKLALAMRDLEDMEDMEANYDEDVRTH